MCFLFKVFEVGFCLTILEGFVTIMNILKYLNLFWIFESVFRFHVEGLAVEDQNVWVL